MAATTLPRDASGATRIAAPRRPSLTRRLRKLPLQLAVAVLLIIEIYPLLWLFLGSLKTEDQLANGSVWALPKGLDWSNYSAAWSTGHMGTYIRNSLVATVPSLILVIVFGTAAGFALEVMIWKGRRSVLLLFLAGIMIPFQMILLPLFTIYFKTGITGTLFPLIITYTASGLPLTVFLMATYFRAVPYEVFEASTLDGASILRSFWSIGFPLVRNAVLTVALVEFFFFWNDLLIALTFTTSDNLRTIQVGLLNFTGQFGATEYGPLFAAICINVLGILALYLGLNQRIMAGLASGSVKG